MIEVRRELLSTLKKLRNLFVFSEVLYNTGKLFINAVIALSACMLLYFVWYPPLAVRVLLSLGCLFFLLKTVKKRILSELLRFPSLLDFTAFVEKSFQIEQDLITNAASFIISGPVLAREEVSGYMIDMHIKNAFGRVQSLPLGSLINRKRLLTLCAYILLFGLAFFTIGKADRGHFNFTLKSLLYPYKNLYSIRNYDYAVSPGGGLVKKGASFSVRADFTKDYSLPVGIKYSNDGEGSHTMEMKMVSPRHYAAVFPKVLKDLSYRVETEFKNSPWYKVKAVSPIYIKEAAFRIIPPVYTGKKEEILQNPSGDIYVLAGSQVFITASLNRKPAQVKGMISGTRKQVPAELTGDNSAKCSFAVTENMKFYLELTDEYGFSGGNPMIYSFFIKEDRFPEVKIIYPASDLELTEKDELKIVYSISDDYGFNSVSFNFNSKFYKKDERVDLTRGVRRNDNYSFLFDLSRYDIQPGDLISYFIRAEDNDIITGPKASASMTYYIKIIDRFAAHKEFMRIGEKINEELLNLLAEEIAMQSQQSSLIKEIPPEDRFSSAENMKLKTMENVRKNNMKSAEGISRDLESMMPKMEKDPLVRNSTYVDMKELSKEFESLAGEDMPESKDRIEEALRTGGGQRKEKLKEAEGVQDDIVKKLERMSINMTDILKNQRMMDLSSMADDMLDDADGLSDMIDKLKKQKDKKLVEKIKKVMDKINSKLKEMMDKLSKMQESYPDEFINSKAMKNLDLGSMSDKLEDMMKSLNEGNVDELLKQAEQMLKQMSELAKSVQSSAKSHMAGEAGGIRDELNLLMSKLNDIIRRQEENITKTELIDQLMIETVLKMQEAAIREAGELVSALRGEIIRNLEDYSSMKGTFSKIFAGTKLDLFGIRNRLSSINDELTKKTISKSSENLEYIMTEMDNIRKSLSSSGTEADVLGELLAGLDADLRAIDGLDQRLLSGLLPELRRNAATDPGDTLAALAFDEKKEQFREVMRARDALLGRLSDRIKSIPFFKNHFIERYIEGSGREMNGAYAYLEQKNLSQTEKQIKIANGNLDIIKKELKSLTELLAQFRARSSQVSDKFNSHLGQLIKISGLFSRESYSPEKILQEKDRKKLEAAAEEEARLLKDTLTLREEFHEVQKRSPMVGGEIGENLREASIDMEQAEGFLRDPNTKYALPAEVEALSHLKEAKDNANSSMNNLNQMMSQQQSGFSLNMKKEAGKESGGREGQTGSEVENVAIPKPEDYIVPEDFRKEVLESMKEKIPESYRDKVEKYYKKITE